MEIGAYSFGDTQLNPDGGHRSTAEAVRNLFDAIKHADAAGLDYFGVGEHHTVSMPASSPGAVIAAAAGATKQIKLGSAASIIGTDDPVRVFQQFAIADAVSGGGRVENSPPAAAPPSKPSRCSATTCRSTTSSTQKSSTC
ncbi:LLM class flavin-dependent oxidoreductase [Arthrobacter sp. H14]|uniref:LLM class flavin-dependent oxidoreductase n=1 Tax=Arthrobacter sp. H14 TaxID=1312959 RepID=UPI000684B424|nr:LLM class flavin-dependent oxidoreductase [Arthrobacter sp. H14]